MQLSDTYCGPVRGQPGAAAALADWAEMYYSGEPKTSKAFAKAAKQLCEHMGHYWAMNDDEKDEVAHWAFLFLHAYHYVDSDAAREVMRNVSPDTGREAMRNVD